MQTSKIIPTVGTQCKTTRMDKRKTKLIWHNRQRKQDPKFFSKVKNTQILPLLGFTVRKNIPRVPKSPGTDNDLWPLCSELL